MRTNKHTFLIQDEHALNIQRLEQKQRSHPFWPRYLLRSGRVPSWILTHDLNGSGPVA